MRHYQRLATDLGWVALSPFLALLIRDNFVLYPPHLEAIIPYAAIAVVVSTIVFVIAGAHKTLWQYASLPDALRIMAAVTVALLLTLFVSFAASRLEGVARSIPVIQWFLLVSALVGTRLAVRMWHERARRNARHDRLATDDGAVQHVLIVGLSHLTELYLQSVAEYAPKTVDIVGILSEQRELRGRLLGLHKVLGTPEELLQVMDRLEVHGIILNRIVVAQPFDQLSRRAGEALLGVEHASGIKVDWMVELLGLVGRGPEEEHAPEFSTPKSHAMQASLAARELTRRSLGKYGYVKRAFDILAALIVSVFFAPILLLVAALVALDVGLPLVFWQKRPGRFGRPFKLFKFCTMRPAHDERGKRVPDENRLSIVGRLLRGTRLDELPQLYNILVGEMSFVGPRPLLPIDQPVETSARLLVRPGLTGLAQVHGGRDITPEEKNALDIWYVRKASLWLDIKILLRTPIVMMRGERVDHYRLRAAWAELEGLKTQRAASTDSHSLISKGVVGDGEVVTSSR